jgi:hypothetical protein
MHYPEGKLLVFAKAPQPGQVKTRLASVYGDRGAAQLYRLMLRECLTKAAGLAPLELWCTPSKRHAYLHTCAQEVGATLRVQKGPDLGMRMYSALAQALDDSPWALVVGSDCVSLSRADLDVACAKLHHGKEAVLGPAEDGGYVLFGLRRIDKGLFRLIRWSNPRVLAQTRQRLLRLHYDWAELPTRWDVDTPKQVRRWRLNREKSRWCSDRTLAFPTSGAGAEKLSI